VDNVQVDASILIVTRDDTDTLRRCLEACLACQAPPHGFEVLVYDDCSAAAQRDLLRCLITERKADVDSGRLRLILSREYAGLPGARNLAAQQAAGRVLFYLDGHASPSMDWLCSTLPLFAEDRVGVVASKVVLERRPDVVEGVGGTLTLFADRVARYGLQPVANVPDESTYVLYAMGCGLAASRECWEAVGGFDESFVNEYDDAEFCLRAWEAGFSVVSNSRCEIRHAAVDGGWSAVQTAHWAEYGRWLTIAKHWPLRLILRAAMSAACSLLQRPDRLHWRASLWAAMKLCRRAGAIWRERARRPRGGNLRYKELLANDSRQTGIVRSDSKLLRAQPLVLVLRHVLSNPAAFHVIGAVGAQAWSNRRGLRKANGERRVALAWGGKLFFRRWRSAVSLQLEYLPPDQDVLVDVSSADSTCRTSMPPTVLPRGSCCGSVALSGADDLAVLTFRTAGAVAPDAVHPDAIIVLKEVTQA
jgi:GT2 family glycosyltransferase